MDTEKVPKHDDSDTSVVTSALKAAEVVKLLLRTSRSAAGYILSVGAKGGQRQHYISLLRVSIPDHLEFEGCIDGAPIGGPSGDANVDRLPGASLHSFESYQNKQQTSRTGKRGSIILR